MAQHCGHRIRRHDDPKTRNSNLFSLNDGALLHRLGPNATRNDSDRRNGKRSPIPGELRKSAEERNLNHHVGPEHYSGHPGTFVADIVTITGRSTKGKTVAWLFSHIIRSNSSV